MNSKEGQTLTEPEVLNRWNEYGTDSGQITVTEPSFAFDQMERELDPLLWEIEATIKELET